MSSRFLFFAACRLFPPATERAAWVLDRTDADGSGVGESSMTMTSLGRPF
jgi:hypothetical protein